ncbi:MAG: FAD-dependent oxidoreductase [Verrucomicrobiota bacterium]
MPVVIDSAARERATENSVAVEAPPSRARKLGVARKAGSLVIIGNGMAGYKLCERLAELKGTRRFQVTVFGEEPRPAYDRVHLTQFLHGRAADQLTLAPREWYRQNGIELFTGDPVVAVDREQRVVRSASGREVRYDQLVFATGSRAFIPSMEGRDLPGVFVYRTVEDLERIRDKAQSSLRAAVLGGGLLGLEAAKAIKDLGVDVWVVERGSSLLARQLDPEGGAVLRAHVERLGLHVCTGQEADRIEEHDGDKLVQFRNGECLRVQMVVIAVGIRPRDELAAACGLKLGQRGGIEVNDFLQTSDPHIFAVGECASHRGTVYGLAAPAFQMADTLVALLLGKRREFTGAEQSTWLKLPGIAVATLGDFQADEETLTARPSGGYRRIVVKDSRLVGAVAVGEWPEQARIQEAIERRRRLWRWQRNRFLRDGRIWTESAPQPVAEWPADAMVCNCLRVRRGALSTACTQGCTTVEQLARTTGASTVCGSCKPLLAELVGAPIVSRLQPGTRLLVVASAIALLLTLVIGFLKPIPFSNTVQGGFKIDVLWTNPLIKQITGFTLVGVAVVSLVLSLPKRIKWISFGQVGWWRAFHATLGAFTLVALVTHTGFRLGHNLNLILMLNFLALALVGALAGGVTALENRMVGPVARRLRALWTGVHIALVWPLPVLIVFHVLTSYYF